MASANHYFDNVYDVVRSIPVGRVTTYGAIADYLGLGSSRMVGWALRNLNSMNGDVPAHRVVNRIGELSGRHNFGAPGMMEALLKSEGVGVENDRVLRFKELFWHPGDGEF